MWHSRLDVITADPQRLEEAVSCFESAVRPEVESQPGSLGISLYTKPDLGMAVLDSVWASLDALAGSEQVAAAARRDAVRRAAATVSVERYQMPVFELDRPLDAGAGLRFTRMDIEPSLVEDGVEEFGDDVVPWLADTTGFLSAQLLVDTETGRAVSETNWLDADALAASRSVAAAMEVEMRDAGGWNIRAVEEYSLVYSSARKA